MASFCRGVSIRKTSNQSAIRQAARKNMNGVLAITIIIPSSYLGNDVADMMLVKLDIDEFLEIPLQQRDRLTSVECC